MIGKFKYLHNNSTSASVISENDQSIPIIEQCQHAALFRLSNSMNYFRIVLGPKLMENRKPFQLRTVLVVYNFVQVLFSAWLFYESSISGWLNGYSFRCEPVDYSYTPNALRDYISSIYDYWRDLMENKADPRTKDYPLMSSPFPTIAICLSYAYFVKLLNLSLKSLKFD
uniref:Elongation of very long chain fatty acids protein n=1 Tax=Glossina brevipalpis TaxID=37001 RepID=A0A1A9WPN5_9MUSC